VSPELPASIVQDPPLMGLEAQRIFCRPLDSSPAFAFISNALPVCYELHLGALARHLITETLTRVRQAQGTEDEVYAICADSRARFERSGILGRLASYKEGSVRRTLHLTRLETAQGEVVDVGCGDNRLGQVLTVGNENCAVTGIDIRTDPALLLDSRLAFAQQPSPTSIPLEDEYADHVLFRYSLHHMLPAAQRSLLTEALRVLKPGGELIVVEDSYGPVPALAGNYLTAEFEALPSETDRLTALSMLDASSCFVVPEEMPFTFSFHSAETWVQIMKSAGFSEIIYRYWGFSMFSLYAAPMTLFTARKL
jgi:ubiquinone/menaquinone biosynthesis C-methylase UbiE